MKLGAVTPTRGTERAAFIKQAARLIEKQTYKPAAWYLIDYKPRGDYVDMVERLLEGVKRATADGVTHLAILEDDDYYRADYLANMAARLSPEVDMMGSRFTPTYHLGINRWGLERANTVSVSLHRCIGSVRFLGWALTKAPKANGMWFVDHYLWGVAATVKATAKVVDTELFDCVAMKHGIGKCGSSYHNKRTDVYPYVDPDMYWLKKFTGDDFPFYAEQVRLLNNTQEAI